MKDRNNKSSKSEGKKSGLNPYLLLHLVLFVYSISGICSKFAARQEFMSVGFILDYGLVILLLGIYAIFWQQVIKKIPLTSAYANKAVSVVWGLIWGFLIFGESITIGKIVGVILVVIGVVLFAKSDGPSRPASPQLRTKSNQQEGDDEL